MYVGDSKQQQRKTSNKNKERPQTVPELDLLPIRILLLQSARYFLAESSTTFYNLHLRSFDVMCLRTPHVYNLVYLLCRTINTVLICSC
jgi:hypothetical protein